MWDRDDWLAALFICAIIVISVLVTIYILNMRFGWFEKFLGDMNR